MISLKKLAKETSNPRKSRLSKFRKYITFALAFMFAVCFFSQGQTVTAANSMARKQLVVTKKAKYVSDSLNGVKAIYRKGRSDGSSKTYSCAAYVKKYYKKVYNVNVYNLLYNRKPSVSNGSIKKVSKPQIGDIVGMNTNHSTTHWAIVKGVNPNNTVTLIEQNWKWQSGGKTYTIKNRRIKISSARFYRLKGIEAEEDGVFTATTEKIKTETDGVSDEIEKNLNLNTDNTDTKEYPEADTDTKDTEENLKTNTMADSDISKTSFNDADKN